MSRLSATRWSVIRAAQAGDGLALEALCAKYRPAIVAYLSRSGLKDEAEDVAQEALLALARSALERADSAAGKFRALVFAVARNHLGKHLERKGALKRGAGRTHSLEVDLAAPLEPDPEFDREWLANLLRTATARLAKENPSSFAALQRFLIDGLPQAEVARELGVPVARVKKLVFGGKRRIARYLREEVSAYAGSPAELETELKLLATYMGEPIPDS